MGAVSWDMTREVQILNPLGLHARPAAEFVRTVRKFRADVRIQVGSKIVKAGSILELMGADLVFGTRVLLIAEGPDALPALNALCSLLADFARREKAPVGTP